MHFSKLYDNKQAYLDPTCKNYWRGIVNSDMLVLDVSSMNNRIALCQAFTDSKRILVHARDGSLT